MKEYIKPITEVCESEAASMICLSLPVGESQDSPNAEGKENVWDEMDSEF